MKTPATLFKNLIRNTVFQYTVQNSVFQLLFLFEPARLRPEINGYDRVKIRKYSDIFRSRPGFLYCYRQRDAVGRDFGIYL